MRIDNFERIQYPDTDRNKAKWNAEEDRFKDSEMREGSWH